MKALQFDLWIEDETIQAFDTELPELEHEIPTETELMVLLSGMVGGVQAIYAA